VGCVCKAFKEIVDDLFLTRFILRYNESPKILYKYATLTPLTSIAFPSPWKRTKAVYDTVDAALTLHADHLTRFETVAIPFTAEDWTPYTALRSLHVSENIDNCCVVIPQLEELRLPYTLAVVSLSAITGLQRLIIPAISSYDTVSWPCLTSLRHLNLSRGSNFPEDLVQDEEDLISLETLILDETSMMFPEWTIERCTALSSLSLKFTSCLSPALVASFHSSLTKLNLYCEENGIDDDVVSCLTNLKHLNIISSTCSHSVLSNLTKLQALSVSLVPETAINFLDFTGLTGLTSLQLCAVELEEGEELPTNIEWISELRNLRTLMCADIMFSEDALGSLTNLTALGLGTDNSMSFVSRLTNLRFLSFSGVPEPTPDNEHLFLEDGDISGLTNLVVLDLSAHYRITNKGLSGLTNLTALSLGYSELWKVTSDVFFGLKKLRHLCLNETSVEPGATTAAVYMEQVEWESHALQVSEHADLFLGDWYVFPSPSFLSFLEPSSLAAPSSPSFPGLLASVIPPFPLSLSLPSLSSFCGIYVDVFSGEMNFLIIGPCRYPKIFKMALA
jgi:hypothetical protein